MGRLKFDYPKVWSKLGKDSIRRKKGVRIYNGGINESANTNEDEMRVQVSPAVSSEDMEDFPQSRGRCKVKITICKQVANDGSGPEVDCCSCERWHALAICERVCAGGMLLDPDCSREVTEEVNTHEMHLVKWNAIERKSVHTASFLWLL